MLKNSLSKNKFFSMLIIIVMLILLLPACNKYLGILDVGIQIKKPSEITEQHVKDWINEVKDKEGDFFLAKSKIEGKEIYYIYFLTPFRLKMKPDKVKSI